MALLDCVNAASRSAAKDAEGVHEAHRRYISSEQSTQAAFAGTQNAMYPWHQLPSSDVLKWESTTADKTRVANGGIVVLGHATRLTDPYAATMAEAEQLIAAQLSATFIGFQDVSHASGRLDPRNLSRRATNAVSTLARRGEYLRAPVIDVEGFTADLAILLSRHPSDLALLNHATAVIGPDTTLVVVLTELWPTFVVDQRQREALRLLRRADLVIVNQVSSLAPLRAHLGVSGPNCRFLPPALDLLRFMSWPEAVRDVDVFAPGRRPPRVHASLRCALESGELRYVFDSFTPASVPDLADHRTFFISQARRARTMLAYPARLAEPSVTGGSVEFGVRYMEAMASGAVPFGHRIDQSTYHEHFDQIPAVLEIGDEDAATVFRRIDPVEEQHMRDRNLLIALGTADWAHRLRTIFRCIGAPVPAGVEERLGWCAAERARRHRKPGVGNALADIVDTPRSTHQHRTALGEEHNVRRPTG
jgi:hypothetical protein